MPWAHQSLLDPVANALGALAFLPASVGSTATIPLFVLSASWISALLTLVTLVASSFHRERHSGALPVKVMIV
jgi:hypothetical protein